MIIPYAYGRDLKTNFKLEIQTCMLHVKVPANAEPGDLVSNTTSFVGVDDQASLDIGPGYTSEVGYKYIPSSENYCAKIIGTSGI